jgi:hypothetical protein
MGEKEGKEVEVRKMEEYMSKTLTPSKGTKKVRKQLLVAYSVHFVMVLRNSEHECHKIKRHSFKQATNTGRTDPTLKECLNVTGK